MCTIGFCGMFLFCYWRDVMLHSPTEIQIISQVYSSLFFIFFSL
ncbi:hypothetical protein SLEP1_g58005 [Rubroshorea leprosula]|uniref:Uncharacterized protein n=1 Tax=Rubroshorea leprosula TaxID=152421 RepID=A0AAV5MRX7_9ROSI|nr:hypothetical protein SLEP1_g58005 [Rubroshorea leprosula]